MAAGSRKERGRAEKGGSGGEVRGVVDRDGVEARCEAYGKSFEGALGVTPSKWPAMGLSEDGELRRKERKSEE